MSPLYLAQAILTPEEMPARVREEITHLIPPLDLLPLLHRPRDPTHQHRSNLHESDRNRRCFRRQRR